MQRSLISLLIFGTSVWAQTASKTAALEGLDPVLLTEGQEVPGKASITAQSGSFLYQFSTEETRDRFNKDPERYGIQLEGACARMGPPVGGSPDTYWVYEHRIYVFGSAECYKRFSANPEKYLDSAQAKPVWNPTAETRSQGKALLRKAIEAMGGADKLDAVHSYIETQHPEGPAGEATVTNSIRIPDFYRNDTVTASFKYGTLITPDSAFRLAGDEGTPVPKSFGDVMRTDSKRELLAILLSRNSKGFDVYHAGRSNGADQIAVNNLGSISKLMIDPASGRISALVWNGRSPDGFGELRLVYSDYRDVGGLQLPFRAERMFDGKPVPGAWTVESYQFNPPGIDAKFQKPVKIREQ